MKARHIAVVVLASAFVVTSVASADADATKQRVQIDMKIHPKKTFALATLQCGCAQARLGDARMSGRT